MKRSGPLPRKRTGKKRRTLSPRCRTLRCGKIARIGEWCRTHAIAECDRRARELARELRWCARCASPDRLQWSHHITRARLRTRWDPRNATMHCAPCHALLTNHPALHVEWIRDHIGEATYADLMDIAFGPRVHDAAGLPLMRQSPGPVHDYEIAVWLEQLPRVEEAA